MGDESLPTVQGTSWPIVLFAEVTGDGRVDEATAAEGLRVFGVDERGLDKVDRAILSSLCERFGVSRTPVREALRQLTATGLVEMRPRRGVIVSLPVMVWVAGSSRALMT